VIRRRGIHRFVRSIYSLVVVLWRTPVGFGEAPYFCKVSEDVPEPTGEMAPEGQLDQGHPVSEMNKTDSVSQANNASIHLCTSAISLVWSNLTLAFFAPQIFTNKTIPALNAGIAVRYNV
jgi:hypothetical protein